MGDEVVTLAQAGHSLIPDDASRDRYVRTGTVGPVTAVNLDDERPEQQWLRVDFASQRTVTVRWDYLTHEFDDGRSGGLAHAYAITADRARGSTMHAARTVATDSTSRPAFYVMVRRGERYVCTYVTRDREFDTRADDEQWLPVLTDPGGPLRAVIDNLERSRVERLASDLDPVAWAAQQLRHGRSLADLAAIARQAQRDPQARGGGGTPLIVARRAELAEQSAMVAAGISSPSPELVARLGGRPARGQNRRSWDAAVGAVAAYRARWSTSAGNPGYGNGARWAIGPRADEHDPPWQDQRAQAEALVARWAATMEASRAERFWAVIEHIPRQRATAGIHALIAAGVDPAALYQALSERERDTAKAGAAILEYRVKELLRHYRVDASAYHLAEPLTEAGEWDRVRRLLDTAEIRALSRRDLRDLCSERRDLLELFGGNASPTAEPTAAELSSAEAGLDQTAAHRDEIRQTLAAEVGGRRPNQDRVADLKRQLSGLERRHAEESLPLDMLRQRRSAATASVDQRAGLRERHDLLGAAIDFIVDDAAPQPSPIPPDISPPYSAHDRRSSRLGPTGTRR